MIRNHRNGRLLSVAALSGTLLLLAACISAPPAQLASINEAEIAIEAAEKIDASHYASAELGEARQKLALANEAVAGKNTILASRYAQESALTAELATARTEAAKAQAVNDELNRGAKALTEELQRTGEQQ